jgi:uncharacterized protein YjdB
MATTVNSDLIIYNDQVQTAYLERMQDVLDVFNAASNGAIVLRNEMIPGDFTNAAFYKVPGSVAHRNVNSTATVNGQIIDADEMVGVKTPWKYGPYETTEEAFKRRARSVEEFSQLIGQHMADATLDYMIQAVFAALTAAIGSNTPMVAQGDWVLDGKKVLTKGMRKFGDRAGRIAIFAMDSTVYFDMVDQAITEKIYEEAGFVIYGGTPGTMGKPVLVSDKIPEDLIFGLQAGAAQVIESQPPGVRSYNIDNQENLAIGYRAEGTFNIDLLGYSWDTVGSPAAPANPNLTQLGSGANWRKYATDNKATAGVLIEVETISPTSG